VTSLASMGEDRGVRRPPVLALASLVLAVACSAAPTAERSAPQRAPTSEPTFVVAGPDPEPLVAQAPRPHGDRIVAAAHERFRVFTKPAAGNDFRAFRAVNDWGQRLWLPVVGRQVDRDGGRWLEVLLPERPNGSTGWVRPRDVRTSVVEERIVVRMSDYTLIRYDGERRVDRYEVAIGKSSTPTTPGRFFVWARVGYEWEQGPYGNFALGLSGFSEVITDWPGGGRMAIHGTSDPSHAGQAVSNGCVRVYNPLMAELIDVPMGATVIIRP
jgi:lipoprotein-anchoring transpeptidase ErfK/SrfK